MGDRLAAILVLGFRFCLQKRECLSQTSRQNSRWQFLGLRPKFLLFVLAELGNLLGNLIPGVFGALLVECLHRCLLASWSPHCPFQSRLRKKPFPVVSSPADLEYLRQVLSQEIQHTLGVLVLPCCRLSGARCVRQHDGVEQSISAVSPPEIAVAIMGEITARLRAGAKPPREPKGPKESKP